MPRYLSIDWEPPKLHLLGVNAGKATSRSEQALSLPLTDDLTTSTASSVGRALKDALASSNIAPAPVLFSVGRDKVILKELMIPFVPAAEEAMVVRFQAAKELTEAANEVVLDYAILTPPQLGRTTRVQVVVVRKSIVAAVTALCQSAGLKLHAIVPRPFALAGLLDRTAASKSPKTRGLLIPISDASVEFCVYSAGCLEWARTLPVGTSLTSEISKNLMLLAAQKPDLPDVDRIETVGVDGLGDVGAPLVPLDPWRADETRPANPNGFLGALGLAELAAGKLAVNLASPKEPKPVVNRSQQRMKAAGIAAAILVPLLLFGFWFNMSRKRAQIRELEETKLELEEGWKRSEQERTDVAALKEWEQSTISWVNELYDISARLPHAQGFRVTQVSVSQVRRPKDKFSGNVTVHGLMSSDQNVLVEQFVESLQADKYLKAISPSSKANEFTVKIEVAPRPPLHYSATLVVPPQPKAAPVAEETPETPPAAEKTPEAPTNE